MDARNAREWSSEAAARDICPNSLRRRCCISEALTGGWSVCDRTDTLVTCAVYRCGEYGVSTTGQKHQDAVSTLLSHSMCPDLWQTKICGCGLTRILSLMSILFSDKR